MNRWTSRLLGLSSTAVLTSLAVMHPVRAQTALAGEAEPAAQGPDTGMNEVIITGTNKARSELTTPFVATSISADQLSALSATSAADILATVPALKAEAGGGEVAANVFVAGLPSTGQYQFTPLEFNGMPVIGSMGLNSTAPDAYYRYDFGVERLEFVRGGVSNLFGGGGIGGLINYIDKTGDDKPQGVAQLELADQNRIRTDFAASGPIANGLYYAISGFYRYDNGPIDTGFPTDGYQVRGNIKREFETGEIILYLQGIDDQDQFYGDLPLSSAGGRPALGNNGRPVYTTETSALDNVSFPTPNGIFHTSVENGAATHGGAFGLSFKKDLGDGWGFDGRGNVAHYQSSFALFSGGDNITNLPTTQAGFLSSYGYKPASAGGPYTGAFTFANSGAAVPGNYLLWGDRVTDRNRPLSSATLELNLTKSLALANWSHHFTLGGFFGHTSAKDDDVTYAYIGDFDNKPQLVNVTVTNAATGAQTIVSQNGLVHPGDGYTNNIYDARRYAGYFADQMEVGKWELDIGTRVETLAGTVQKELTSTFTSNTAPNLSPLLANVIWGNGAFLSGNVATTSWALAGDTLYQLNDHNTLFVNASRGFFMPQLNSVQIAADGQVQSYDPEIIDQFEGGLKYSDGPIFGSLSLFSTALHNERNVQFVNGATPGSAPAEVANLVSTRAYGTEGVFNWRIVAGLSLTSNLTWQHDWYTQYSPIAGCNTCVGNALLRQPDFDANAGLAYAFGMFDVSIRDTYTGKTYTSDLNNIELAGYHLVHVDAGYSHQFTSGDTVRMSLSVYNLLDSQAATEGNPRQGSQQIGGQAYFVGRDVLPRRIFYRINYKF